MRTRHDKRDANEPALIGVARQLGAQFRIGPPLDGWIIWRGVWLPVEIKLPEREGTKHEYTPAQKRFFTFCRDYGGRWLTWRTDADVIRDLGGRRAA